MNVANLSMSNGASGTVTVQGGAAAGSATSATGLGELFSLQMGFALQTMQPDEDAAPLGQGMSEEEMKALENLLALIQQMLVAQDQGNEELDSFLENNGKAIEQWMQKVQSPLPNVAEDVKQLLAKLSQNEPASDELKQLAALLAKLKNEQEESGMKRNPSQVRSESFVAKTVVQEEMGKAIQPLRINQGLSAYKAEAGIQSPSAQAAWQTSNMMNQEGNDSSNQQHFGGQAPLVAQAPVQTGQAFQRAEVPAHPVSANQLPEQVTQIFVKQMNLTQLNGVHQAKLILNPQSLGQVDVTITSKNGVITAHFAAETQAGREMLDNQLGSLRAALSQQGLQVDRLEVTQQQQAENFGFQQQREQAKQQQEQQSQQKQEDEQAEFSLDALIEENEASGQWAGSGVQSREIDDIV